MLVNKFSQTYGIIRKAYGDKAIGQVAVYKWFRHFRESQQMTCRVEGQWQLLMRHWLMSEKSSKRGVNKHLMELLKSSVWHMP
jgi:hypothetical protein